MVELAKKIAADFNAASTTAKIELAGTVLVIVVIIAALF